MFPQRAVMPLMPVGAYRTYSVSAPRSTHFRPATCAEAGCLAHHNGWRTVVDEATPLGQGQAAYIRRDSRRRFREERRPDGTTAFTFEAGQTCFRAGEHRVRLDRPEIYVVRGGDWRGHTGETRTHRYADDWVDDFGSHQQNLADLMDRG